MTGADAFGVVPDILNVAKQLTNGAVPMGAVIASSEIHDTFMANGGPDYVLEFAHGYTYSAHPVACAADWPHSIYWSMRNFPNELRPTPHSSRRYCTIN